MSILHTVNKSPYSYTTLASCLAVCSENDAVLLLENGVFAAINSAPGADQLQKLAANGISVFALADDIKARGINDKLAPNISLIDYNSFVELSLKHSSVQSWY